MCRKQMQNPASHPKHDRREAVNLRREETEGRVYADQDNETAVILDCKGIETHRK